MAGPLSLALQKHSTKSTLISLLKISDELKPSYTNKLIHLKFKPIAEYLHSVLQLRPEGYMKTDLIVKGAVGCGELNPILCHLVFFVEHNHVWLWPLRDGPAR